VASTSVDTVLEQRHQRLAVHGGVARQRRNLTLLSNHAQPIAWKGKIEGGEVGYLEGRL
jgi:hypothetical protein